MLTWEDSIGPQHQAPALQFRTVTKEKGRDDPDDFSGISLGGMAFILTVMALRHPWQSLKELLRVVRRLGRSALRLAMAPAALVAAIVLSRRRDRRPTFEDHLHGRDEE
ncbi:hypothetical protein IMZ11_28590 [Microtetraspora sp. AC03309]|uniref:hypothetical protein n=1 Tax=Microtetraspora sp. AC03309 TaxID=2779376 RepID=UPI001E2A0D88|nr:hypothetical protein [Microtetraspora sp. AC03309]MCC5579594.1 hypothetical protein [Microtetraspora sp. AC03309]